MRSDVLKAIADSKDITNAVILTHNIDFVFLQTVVLSAFRKCGHPRITVFADAHCAAESFTHQAGLLDGLGVRYRVVPVAMASGFRFHPKAVLLSGQKDATLFVGSGNLTFGGYRENAEIWLRFDATVDGASVFGEFHRYTETILERVPLSSSVREELMEAFDTTTRSWLPDEQPSTARAVLGRCGTGVSLLDEMSSLRGTEAINELVVCSPYFDAEGAALHALVERMAPERTAVLCQPSRSTLTNVAFQAAGGTTDLQQVSFDHQSVDGKPRTAFVHAKFYALLSGEQATVFAGSANCSRAALIASGSAGNAELLAVSRMSAADFETLLVGELQRIPAPVLLPDTKLEQEDPSVIPSIRVLAARFEQGSLRVGFAPARVELRACEIDGRNVNFNLTEPGVISAGCSGEPRALRLEALVDGVSTWSTPAWIDHERHLRASARGRSLVDSIRARMQLGSWHAPAWAEVMDVFCKHLTYLPMPDAKRAIATTTDSKDASVSNFSFADVFSSTYQLPALASSGPLLEKLSGGKERSLQQLLLRWFGVVDETEGVLTAGTAESEHDNDEDLVDRPEAIRAVSKARESVSLTEAEKRRIYKVLKQVEAAMTAEEFLAQRQPEWLAADLKTAAVLLRTGVREGWLDAPDFYEFTHHIWASLFFSGSPQANQGWLEYRVQQAEDPMAFIAAMRSPELAAALLGWAFAAVSDTVSPASARFHLAVALAVARLPWLWDTGDEMAVARELEVLLANTGVYEASTPEPVRAAWERMVRRGHALLRLEAAAMAVPLPTLRTRIQYSELLAGDLLWQGGAGYCVVTDPTTRAEGVWVPVLKLQTQPERASFQAQFTVPIASLIDEMVLPMSSKFGSEPRRILREFLEVLREGFSGSVAEPALGAR